MSGLFEVKYLHTPWWNISIHYPKSWAGAWWMPDLVKLACSTKATVGYVYTKGKKRYKA